MAILTADQVAELQSLVTTASAGNQNQQGFVRRVSVLRTGFLIVPILP